MARATVRRRLPSLAPPGPHLVCEHAALFQVLQARQALSQAGLAARHLLDRRGRGGHRGAAAHELLAVQLHRQLGAAVGGLGVGKPGAAQHAVRGVHARVLAGAH